MKCLEHEGNVPSNGTQYEMEDEKENRNYFILDLVKRVAGLTWY